MRLKESSSFHRRLSHVVIIVIKPVWQRETSVLFTIPSKSSDERARDKGRERGDGFSIAIKDIKVRQKLCSRCVKFYNILVKRIYIACLSALKLRIYKSILRPVEVFLRLRITQYFRIERLLFVPLSWVAWRECLRLFSRSHLMYVR